VGGGVLVGGGVGGGGWGGGECETRLTRSATPFFHIIKVAKPIGIDEKEHSGRGVHSNLAKRHLALVRGGAAG